MDVMKHVTGERRKPKADEQLRALAAAIPDQETLNGFMLAQPAAQRRQIYALIAPHITQFAPAGAVATDGCSPMNLHSASATTPSTISSTLDGTAN